jgi:hypothetical protein
MMGEPLRGLDDIIARDTLSGTKADGSSIVVAIEIGRPFPWGGTSPTEWACSFRVDPLYNGESHGEGGLQALCLALQTVQWQLDDFQKSGGVLRYEDGEAFSCTNFWPAKPY